MASFVEPIRTAGAWPMARAVLARALGDLGRAWRSMALTALTYRAVAFALLTPATALLLRWLRSGRGVVADTDLVWFFLATPEGLLTIAAGGSLTLTIAALETACLMATGHAAAKGTNLSTRAALAYGAAHSVPVLRLAWRVLARVFALALPFLAGAGLAYGLLLREHDINYYLAQRPPELWAAVALVAVLAAVLAVLLVRLAARWALALPLVLFEGVGPRQALAASSERSAAGRFAIVATLVVWAAASFAAMAAATAAIGFLGRSLAPHFVDSLPLLLAFLTGLIAGWTAVSLAVQVAASSLFAALVVRLYLQLGAPPSGAASVPSAGAPVAGRLSRRAVAALTVVSLLVALGAALLAFPGARSQHPVLVIGHRGTAAAPENTLAAFRMAAEQGADYVELDVQESKDGEVLVVHDSDLMKAGGAALKIWEADATTLRSVDVGSRAGAQFAAERVPTLAEALALCKGRCRVVVELKSYGHAQRLEERVVALVEAAGMENDCIFMSLDHAMVRKLKELRPGWRCGALVAKALGDLTELGADFLAVEVRMATRDLVRRAHRAGQQVYVWTVNDVAWMLTALGSGVDGLITDRPDLARTVLARRDELSDAQRLLVALLVRLGARTEALAKEDSLRP